MTPTTQNMPAVKKPVKVTLAFTRAIANGICKWKGKAPAIERITKDEIASMTQRGNYTWVSVKLGIASDSEKKNVVRALEHVKDAITLFGMKLSAKAKKPGTRNEDQRIARNNFTFILKCIAIHGKKQQMAALGRLKELTAYDQIAGVVTSKNTKHEVRKAALEFLEQNSGKLKRGGDTLILRIVAENTENEAIKRGAERAIAELRKKSQEAAASGQPKEEEKK